MICDQCSKKRTRCNRERPICYRCALAGVICTWERADNKTKKRSFGRVSMTLDRKQVSSAIQSQPRVNIYKIDSKKGPKGSIVKVFIYRSKDKRFLATKTWNSAAKKWLSKPSHRIIFNVFIKACGINLLFLSKEDEKLIFRFLSAKYSPEFKFNAAPLHLLYNGNESLDLLKLSTEAYFFYFNNYWPLMTYHQFVSKPRSKLLKLAICTTGLCFLPRSALRDTLMNSCNIQLKALIIPSKCEFSLDTVQAILVYSIFCIQRKDSGNSNSLVNLAAVLLSGLGNKSSCENSEWVLARRFLANMEALFLHHLYYYTEEDLACYQHNLKSLMIIKKSLFLRLSNWKTTLTISSTYPLDAHHYMNLELFVSLIFSEANTLLLKKPKDLSSQLLDHCQFELSEFLVLANKAINNLKQYYCHLILTLTKFLTDIASFIRQQHSYKDLQTILNDLTNDLNLIPIFHNFKITLCFAILQVYDIIPLYHYFYKSSQSLLRPITLQSLFFASQLVRLIQKVNLNFPYVILRPHYIVFAYRIYDFHSQFLPPFKSTTLQHARTLIQSYLQFPHLAPSVKGFRQLLK